MTKNVFKFLLIIALIFTASNPLFAQRRIQIRLASLVPENTPWGAAINRMAAEWARITNNEVQVIVFHNATAGNESEVLRKLRMNELQAAVFTSMGMNQVMPEVMALSYPFLIRNDAELDEVMRRLKPDLDSRIQQNGFVTLAWARAGWIKFFSKTPLNTPSDLRRVKLAFDASDEQMLQAFRIMGYQMIPSSLSQSLSDLNSGRVDALYQSPVYAASSQIFGIAKYMTNINIAPFMGGVLMNETAWRRIPERYRPQLLEICKRMEREIESSILNLEAEAVSTMVRYGLQINELNSSQVQEWYDDTARFEARLTGTNPPVFNRDYYNRINSIVTEFRRGQR